MKQKKIALLIGSLRKESLNRKMAKAIIHASSSTLKFEVIELGDLPLYNEDLDDQPPTPWVRFRTNLKSADGLLFVTPEYNRSVPGVLKNAIDIASRPYGSSVLNGKPGAVMSVSPGAGGGFGANHHLRQSLVFLNVPTMQQPEAYMANAKKLFDHSGRLTSETTRDFIEQFLSSFEDWITCNGPRKKLPQGELRRSIQLRSTHSQRTKQATRH